MDNILQHRGQRPPMSWTTFFPYPRRWFTICVYVLFSFLKLVLVFLFLSLAHSSLLEAPDRFESYAGITAAGGKAPPRVYKLPFPMQVCACSQMLSCVCRAFYVFVCVCVFMGFMKHACVVGSSEVFLFLLLESKQPHC